IYFTSTNYKRLGIFFSFPQSLLKGMNDDGSIGLIIFLPGDYHMGTIGEWFWKTLKGLTPHNNVMSSGQFFKASEIIREMPNQIVILPQSVVLGCSSDECDSGHKSGVEGVFGIIRRGRGGSLS